VLIHIIKVEGSEIPSEILISEHEWTGIKDIYLEPDHQSVPMEKQGDSIILHLEADQIDPVDTILRLGIIHD